MTTELMLSISTQNLHFVIIKSNDNLYSNSCLRTVFSIYRSAFKLEDGFETICQQGMENPHLVRKLVSIRTNGVPLFSIFPKCSPIRNGDAKEETHRCCIGVYL